MFAQNYIIRIIQTKLTKLDAHLNKLMWRIPLLLEMEKL